MFCFKCGKEIEDFMRFCPGCGVSLDAMSHIINERSDEESNKEENNKERSNKEENSKEESNKEGNNKEENNKEDVAIITDDVIEYSNEGNFLYQKNVISFSEQEILYNKIRVKYHGLARVIAYNYQKKYKEFNGADRFLKEGNAIAMGYIDKLLDEVVSMAIDLGIYDISKETLINDYGKYFLSPWLDAYESIEEKYMALDATEEEMNRYRTARRQNRGKFVGGGFGIQGALKGAAKAGALNMATGAAHGLFNIAGSITSSIIKSSKKSNIYNDKKTLNCLRDGLFNSVIALADVCSDCFGIEIPEYNDNKIINLLSNIDKIPNEKRAEILSDCIKLNPYNENVYYEAIRNFGDPDGEIDYIAGYFGLDIEVSDFKQAMVYYKFAKDVKNAKKDYKNVDKIKNNILDLFKYLGVKDDVYSDNELYNEIIGIEERAQEFEAVIIDNYEEIDKELNGGNINFVWEQIKLGNVYAEYAMEKYYTDIVCKTNIDKHSTFGLMEKIKDVQVMANGGLIYAKYLIAYLLYKTYDKDSIERTKAIEDIIKISEQGNISAIGQRGFWGSQGYYNATDTKEQGVKYLEKAAEMQHPTACAWLGSYYRTGSCGLPIDKDKSEYYLVLAHRYHHPYGEKELQKLRKGDTSPNGSCYITTAVCDSFGKSDDCYELTMFRNFRDNWLIKQSDGKTLIEEYYNTAPDIVNKINSLDNKNEIYMNIWNEYLSNCLNYLENKQYNECKELYCKMVVNLKRQYIK